ncbi:MAG: hypothetical protein UX04_C0006G0014 [Microgenomates group bacterium GW2011_GWF2_45_18]|nr:MAG: hypothetical protein UW18_C0006G0014 [Microgenomates group bacterium GW2011_GWF1_44_10]KKU01479.1 MAG: hypothetical protein UX04_C0006G0014 [Microgenomates group bacterium GW2011_GWF2_45_18]OGJ40588.1 MAG: hypothetical protein A2378_01895 [Candidatus Pacebacteria bacterium RIFOXYB1_FULL_44_10]HAU99389.1 hypothetical protein [Candidatus Paceibacterota bacterium]HAX01606.1 hypothetical protein [Candidatus Paceibacterota bacterium]
MPRFDQTGPQGKGPVTGRGLGRCSNRKGMSVGFGRCRGYGRGLGRYFGWNDPQTKEEEIEDLLAYKKALLEEIEDIEKDLNDVQKTK